MSAVGSRFWPIPPMTSTSSNQMPMVTHGFRALNRAKRSVIRTSPPSHHELGRFPRIAASPQASERDPLSVTG